MGCQLNKLVDLSLQFNYTFLVTNIPFGILVTNPSMQTIPSDILTQFSAVLEKRAVPLSHHPDYLKWLRYYLDFRSKYKLPDSRSEHVRMFVQKLRDKGQTSEQQKQAAHALSLFFESQPKSTLSHCHTKPIPTMALYPSGHKPLKGREITASSPKVENSPALEGKKKVGRSSAEKDDRAEKKGGSRFNEWWCLEKTGAPDWDKVIEALDAEIKTRHYSRKTLKTYADWCRKFQIYQCTKGSGLFSCHFTVSLMVLNLY